MNSFPIGGLPPMCALTPIWWAISGDRLQFMQAINMTSRSSVSGEEEQKRLRAQAEEELRQLKVRCHNLAHREGLCVCVWGMA